MLPPSRIYLGSRRRQPTKRPPVCAASLWVKQKFPDYRGAMDELKYTPLYHEHQRLGAQMAPFGGWLMPIQYPAGILAESKWCRGAASLFDISHMGEFYFKGDIQASGLERMFSCNLAKIPVGKGRYGFLLNDAGGIIDDLIIFRFSADELMIVVNAATTEKDFKVIRSGLRGEIVFTDISAETAKLDIQGPLSREVLVKFLGESIVQMPYFGFKRMEVLGSEAIVSRTGYTGELGYEIYLKSDTFMEAWHRLLADERVKPAGLGARDVLRLEMGYSLYGSDIDETTSPLEAGLGQFVDFGKEFVGRDVLVRQQQQGLARERVAFRVSSRRSPRHDYEIFHDNNKVGRVTSGVFSPMLGCGIGLGYVSPEAAKPGTSLVIRHDTTSMDATAVDLPFYAKGSLRK
jgi:aminomethyltransferase